MWDHFLRLGENEIANSARAYGYATTADCPSLWMGDKGWGGIAEALGDAPYRFDFITDAPWYDVRDESTERFYGVYVHSVDNIVNSTRQASVTEGITPGGVAGRVREAGRTVRVRVWLTARGKDALDTGEAWLSAMLSGSPCGMHGEACGESDLLFFSKELPLQGELGPDIFDREQKRARRHLHKVTCISGPITVQERASTDGLHYGRMLEFSLYAGVPYVYGEPRTLEVQPTTPDVIQDIPYNLVTHPSAEKPGPDTVVATNYSTNPSLEVDATGWEAKIARVTGSDPASLLTSGISTDISAIGANSFRARINPAAGGGLAGRARITLEQQVSVAAAPAGSRFSATIWGAAFLLAGTGTLDRMSAYLVWGDGGRVDMLDSFDTDLGGRVFAKKSLLPPAGVTTVRVILSTDVSWASGSDIRVYADTLGVTVP